MNSTLNSDSNRIVDFLLSRITLTGRELSGRDFPRRMSFKF